MKLLGTERDGPMPIERVLEDGKPALQRRRREGEQPLDRPGVDRHAGRAEPSIEQDLSERTTERVAHDDRRRVEPFDDALIVLEDLLDPEVVDRRGVGSQRVDVALHAGPAARYDAKAALLVAGRPVFP